MIITFFKASFSLKRWIFSLFDNYFDSLSAELNLSTVPIPMNPPKIKTNALTISVDKIPCCCNTPSIEIAIKHQKRLLVKNNNFSLILFFIPVIM